MVQPDARELEEMWRVNVTGTQNAYTAAAASGCKLFVHMSSAGIYGFPRRPEPFQEDDVPIPVTPYQRTKWEAEKALRLIDRGNMTLNILRPAGIYGPGSYLEISQYKKVLRQRWVLDVKGGVVVHPTYVQDIVHAILAIVAEPAPHETVMNIGGDRPIQFQHLQVLLAKTMGVQRHQVVLPRWLGTPLALLGEPILALRGRPNPLLGRMCRGDLFSAAVDDSRFRSRYPDVPVARLEDGLRDTVEWATAHHLL